MNTEYTVTDTGVRSVIVNGHARYELGPVGGINFHERCEYIDKVINLSRSNNESYHLIILTVNKDIDNIPLDAHLTEYGYTDGLDVHLTEFGQIDGFIYERTDYTWNIYVPYVRNVDALEYVRGMVRQWFEGTV